RGACREQVIGDGAYRVGRSPMPGVTIGELVIGRVEVRPPKPSAFPRERSKAACISQQQFYGLRPHESAQFHCPGLAQLFPGPSEDLGHNGTSELEQRIPLEI